MLEYDIPPLGINVLKSLKIVLAFVPWVAASYAFFWLDSSGTWTSDTPHRGKLSVLILASGLLLSFLLHSWLSRSERK